MKFLYKQFLDKSFIEAIESECIRQKDLVEKAINRWSFLSIKKDNDLAKFFETQRKWKRFVQVGMGGSTLGAQALCSFLGIPKSKSVEFIDDIGIAPASFGRETLYHIVSKSGSTTETIANFIYLVNHLKIDKKQIIISTGSSGFLADYAKNHGIKRFLIPEEIGGRYSVFTSVGMAVASFLGYDINKIFDGIKDAIDSFRLDKRSFPYLFAVITSKFFGTKRQNLVLFCYSERLLKTVYWFRQLWAESLGKLIDKNGNKIRAGQTPIIAKGTADQHSQLQLYREGPLDKLFCFIRGPINRKEKLKVDPDFNQFDYLSEHCLDEIRYAEYKATQQSLAKDSPVVSLEIDSYSERLFGLLTMNLMLATAIAGEILNIDAFNQPGVELGKKLARKILSENEI